MIKRDSSRSDIHHLSPDGRWIVVSSYDRLRIATVKGQAPKTVLDTDPDGLGAEIYDARWSPDGRKLAFARHGGEDQPVFVVNRDGSGLRQVAPDGLYLEWSPDSRRVAALTGPTDKTMLVVARADGSGHLEIAPSSVPHRPVWSPRGDWIAYQSRAGGYLHLIRPDGSSDRRVVHGLDPSWSSDGRAFVVDRFARGSGTLSVVDLRGRLLRALERGDFDARPSGHQSTIRSSTRSGRLTTTTQLFAISADGTNRRKLTNDPELDPNDGDTENILRVIWVRNGPFKGKRIFYLRESASEASEGEAIEAPAGNRRSGHSRPLRCGVRS